MKKYLIVVSILCCGVQSSFSMDNSNQQPAGGFEVGRVSEHLLLPNLPDIGSRSTPLDSTFVGQRHGLLSAGRVSQGILRRGMPQEQYDKIMSIDASTDKTIYNNALYWSDPDSREKLRGDIITYFNELNRKFNGGGTISAVDLSAEEIISLYAKILIRHQDSLERQILKINYAYLCQLNQIERELEQQKKQEGLEAYKLYIMQRNAELTKTYRHSQEMGQQQAVASRDFAWAYDPVRDQWFFRENGA